MPIYRYSILIILQCLYSVQAHSCEQNLSTDELKSIAQRIYLNECNAQSACLVDWNPGEAFPSLGIGHFIWYPADVDPGYVESFPLLIEYIKQKEIPLPGWLAGLHPFDAPWPDRDAFLNQRNHPATEQLRLFLSKNQAIQIEFMQRRMRQSLDKIVTRIATVKRNTVQNNIDQLCGSVQGQYALIDYVNFKGEGLSEQERYHGAGWGLMQVVTAMPPTTSTAEAVKQFAISADAVLTQRAQNAKNPIEMEQWLPGWRKRIQTYPVFPAPRHTAQPQPK